MFTSGNQITRDDVKRVMNSGSLNPAAGSRFMGGAMNNTGNDENIFNCMESRMKEGKLEGREGKLG